MSEEEFNQLSQDVQFCRVSWPICLEMGEPIRLNIDSEEPNRNS